MEHLNILDKIVIKFYKDFPPCHTTLANSRGDAIKITTMSVESLKHELLVLLLPCKFEEIYSGNSFEESFKKSEVRIFKCWAAENDLSKFIITAPDGFKDKKIRFHQVDYREKYVEIYKFVVAEPAGDIKEKSPPTTNTKVEEKPTIISKSAALTKLKNIIEERESLQNKFNKLSEEAAAISSSIKKIDDLLEEVCKIMK